MRRFFLPLACGFLFSSVSVHAQTPPTPAAAPTPSPTRETTQMMSDRVLRETSKIRGLSIKRRVPASVKTRAQIEKYMGIEITRQVKQGEISAANLYLRQLGLAPRNFDLRSAYTRLLGEQIAGFYDPKTGAFTTSANVNPLELEMVMSHELTHSLQDQHFNLGRLEKWPRHESDSKLAYSALIEGDATLVMSRYTTADPVRTFGVFASSLSSLFGMGNDRTELLRTPRILRSSLTFPYVSGLTFVTQLQARGGWAAVSKAYKRLPQSTQQILHFDKYLANKAPENVAVPDVRRVLGKGWTLLDHDVNGELGFSLVAGENGNEEEARAAAAGWSGDRYAVYSGPKGAILVVQDSLWNDTTSATKWRDAYAMRTQARFPSAEESRRTSTVVSRIGRKLRVQNVPLSVWNAAPDAVWVQQHGRRVIMLEGTVGAFDAKHVLEELHLSAVLHQSRRPNLPLR